MRNALILVLAVVTFASCSRMGEEELLQSAQNLYKEKKYQEAIEKYQELIDRFPEGKNAETSQFFIASICNDDLHDYPKAVDALRKCIESWPKGENAPKAQFMIGFIYNNQLQEYDSAKAAYRQFLAQYPDHEMAPSARFELETIGKSIEEVFVPKMPQEKPAVAEKPKKK